VAGVTAERRPRASGQDGRRGQSHGKPAPFRRRDAFRHIALLTHNSLSTDERFGGALDAMLRRSSSTRLPLENIHAVLHRLRRAVPDGEGVLVANDLLDLALASAFDCGRT